MNNTYFIFQLPYHTEKFNRILHIDPFVYEIVQHSGSEYGYDAIALHRIKDNKFVSRKATKLFTLLPKSTLEHRLFDKINDDNYYGKQIGGGTWLVCSQLGIAYYKKLLLMRKVLYRVCENIEIITFQHPNSLLPKYKTHFKECSTYIERLKSMKLFDLLEKTKMEFPECFI